ncbi:MAG: acylneuraminate cytidylyltransferase family protein [Rhodospirillales bacterium]
MRTLAIITARGGSKRVPRKNLRPVGGKPLIAWTVEAAQAAKTIDRLIVSSDDPEIIETCRAMGCEAPFIRPAELADDAAASVDVAVHALNALEEDYDIGVLLQPASPLRRAEDIDGCVARLTATGADTCVSVSPVTHAPDWHCRVRADGVLARAPAPSAEEGFGHMLNGAVFAFRTQAFLARPAFYTETTQAYVMPEDRNLDIDTEWQLRMADLALRAVQGELSA